jgi:thiol:disulfide interchange protein DsbC
MTQAFPEKTMNHHRPSPRIAPFVAAFALACLAAGVAQAQAPAPAATGEAAALKKSLEQKFPGADIGSITKTTYLGGLYEVQFDDRLIYTDAKGNHIIVGAVYDSATKANLTEERLRKLNRIDWSNLPLELAIKKVKGKGERKMVIFSDADCPFCKKLEDELKSIDNVTTYTFLFPIDQLHPDAARKSRQIWCSDDRQKSWDEFFVSGKLPDNKGDCPNPVAATQALGARLKITATPTMVLADGTLVPGALPAARLEAAIKEAEAEAKKPAAAKK